MLIIPALALVGAAGLFATALLKPAARPAGWLIFFLLNYANVVLTGELASLLGLLNQAWFFLVIHALLALIAGLYWWQAGQPDLLESLLPARNQLTLARLRSIIQAQPALAVLTFSIVLVLIYSAILIVVVPPNNNDALRYHLARVGYWLQHGSLAPWPTVMIQQIYPPVDAQLNFLWLILFTGHDKLVGFVQWISVLSTAIGIYGLATLLGWERSRAYFSALIFLTYPIVVLQSSSAQIDMITTALFVAVVYFFIRAFSKQERLSLFFSAFAFGLGLGTKSTFFYLIPVLGILFIAVLIKQRQAVIKPMIQWIIYMVVCYGAVGVYSHVINLQAFDHPLGPTETVNYISGINDPAYMIKSLGYNIPRMLYNAIDTAGLPRPLDGYAHKVKAYAALYVFKTLHYEIEGTQFAFYDFPFRFMDKNLNQEDNAWFGPLSVLLLLPALIQQLILGIRSRDPYRISLALMLPAFLFIQNLLWPNWSPYNGRYYTPVVATATSLIAGFSWEGGGRKIAHWLLIGLAIVIASVTVLYNPAKQTLGKQAKWVDIWTADRATVMTIQAYADRDLMRLVQRRVPTETTLGVAQISILNHYALFGEGLTRRLIPVYPTTLLTDPNWLNAQGIQYLLVERHPDMPPVLEAFELMNQIEGWQLYRRR